ncbi:MAG TPA: ABC transporter permease [Candidatus Limnocylindria bacterium]|nr:ABC transporter permease [Candidatus Limnocylindria bacterium]
MGIVKLVARILAVIGKEIIEVFRRPGAVFSLILGPFLILAVFGAGYQGYKEDLRAIVVVDAASTLPTDLATYHGLGIRGFAFIDILDDRAAAEARLSAGEVDLVIVAPTDVVGSVEAGRQAELQVVIDVTDPVAANYASFLADTMAAAVNREIYRQGAAEGQAYAITMGGRDLSAVPPDVIASPTRAVLTNLSPVAPSMVGYFGPAALALVLQHMAVTLIALSIVRERTSGALDRFRSSPLRATELVTGKVVAFGLLGGAIAALSVWLLVSVLGVPMLGGAADVALVVGLLLVASLGLGLLISVISDSERQAVQLSLLTLLASMFFSGFILRTEEFQPLVQSATNLLPVTHGIALLQQTMLTGSIGEPWQLVALGGIGAVVLALSWILLRRELRPA